MNGSNGGGRPPQQQNAPQGHQRNAPPQGHQQNAPPHAHQQNAPPHAHQQNAPPQGHQPNAQQGQQQNAQQLNSNLALSWLSDQPEPGRNVSVSMILPKLDDEGAA